MTTVDGVRAACAHNTMIEHDDPLHAWKCADCGYVYGTEPVAELAACQRLLSDLYLGVSNVIRRLDMAFGSTGREFHQLPGDVRAFLEPLIDCEVELGQASSYLEGHDSVLLESMRTYLGSLPGQDFSEAVER